MESQFISRKQLRARAEHTCSLCGFPILLDAEHIFIKTKQGKTFAEIRRHIHCDAICEAWEKQSGKAIVSGKGIKELRKDLEIINCEKSCSEADRKICRPNFGSKCKIFSCEICMNNMLPPIMMNVARKSMIENDMELSERDALSRLQTRRCIRIVKSGDILKKTADPDNKQILVENRTVEEWKVIAVYPYHVLAVKMGAHQEIRESFNIGWLVQHGYEY